MVTRSFRNETCMVASSINIPRCQPNVFWRSRNRTFRCGPREAALCSDTAMARARLEDRKSTRLNSSHVKISYAVFCLKKKKKTAGRHTVRRTWLSVIALAAELLKHAGRVAQGKG